MCRSDDNRRHRDVLCRVLQVLADGTAALVEWRLLTGRTHQIRVHAKHIGCPLFGDPDYGGIGAAISTISRSNKQRCSPYDVAVVVVVLQPEVH